MAAESLILLAAIVLSTRAMSEGLRGDHVCIYEDRLLGESTSTVTSNETVPEDYEPILVKQCCPGYETVDGVTCQPSGPVDPFQESRFTLALGALLCALVLVAILSMLVAYSYHYRFQRRSRNFEEVPQGIPNPGFTYTEKPNIDR
uniref:EGF-like domain-containing protein n=1 Tax=Steinernema glaseri TaxID=37863 RepID=A0A1I8A6F2_9BILA